MRLGKQHLHSLILWTFSDSGFDIPKHWVPMNLTTWRCQLHIVTLKKSSDSSLRYGDVRRDLSWWTLEAEAGQVKRTANANVKATLLRGLWNLENASQMFPDIPGARGNRPCVHHWACETWAQGPLRLVRSLGFGVGADKERQDDHYFATCVLTWCDRTNKRWKPQIWLPNMQFQHFRVGLKVIDCWMTYSVNNI